MRERFFSFITYLLMMLLFVPFMISATAVCADGKTVLEAGFLPGEIVFKPNENVTCDIHFAIVNIAQISDNITTKVYTVRVIHENGCLNNSQFENYKLKSADMIIDQNYTADVEGIFVSRIYGSYYFRSYL